MVVFESNKGRRIIGRLERGDNLLESLLTTCEKFDVKAGFIRGLGAFETAELTEYDIEKGDYRPPFRLEGLHELLMLNGNVSFKEGRPFLHLHALLSSVKPGACTVYGGHLLSATVFACEFEIVTSDDVELVRKADTATGLSLWQESGKLKAKS
ncbi:MAG: DUF296 domain-containing protein [Deltaproteobacteria bacterium]|nr:DUF296 domain-containing protein [Deltaproteobacteria bacterium]